MEELLPEMDVRLSYVMLRSSMLKVRVRAAAAVAGILTVSACAGGQAPIPPPAQGKSITALDIPTTTSTLTASGQTLQLTARVFYSDNSISDVTAQAAWVSSNASVATVSAGGLVTAVDNGSVGISATYQGRTASAVVTVDLVNDFDWRYLGGIIATGVVDTGVDDIVVDPRDNDLLYVSADRGLFVSRNQGATWTQYFTTPAGTNDGVLALDKNNPDRVFYGVRNTLLVSADKGTTWRVVKNDFADSFRSLAVSRLDSRTIYVGLQGPSNSGIFRSTDDGATWESHAFPYQVFGVTQFIPWSIAEDPIDGTLYVATELHDHPPPYHPPAFRSIDRGVSWQDITGALPWHGQKIIVQPRTQQVLFLTEGAGLFASTDHGLSWTRLGNAIFADTLVIDPNNLTRFFGGELVDSRTGRSGGAFLSTDDAVTFDPYGLEGRIVSSLSLSGDSTLLFAACYNSGIFVRRLP